MDNTLAQILQELMRQSQEIYRLREENDILVNELKAKEEKDDKVDKEVS